MITFKQYLTESRVKTVDVDDAIAWMEKNAKGYLSRGNFLYRGIAGGYKGVSMGDASVGTPRKSKNTSNNYTLWMDNHPSFHGKPRRGNAFITTTNPQQAGGYGPIQLVIPADTAKVGIIGDNDMWDKKLSGEYTMLVLNEETSLAFDELHVTRPQNFDDLKYALKQVTLAEVEHNEELEEYTSLGTLMRKHHVNNLLELWTELVKPEIFRYTEGSSIKGKGEIWIDGEAVLIPLDSSDIPDHDRSDLYIWAREHASKLEALLKEYWDDDFERIDPDTVSAEDTLTHTQKRKQR